MKLLFERSFLKDLERLNDSKTKEQVLEIIDLFEINSTFEIIPNLKKLKGYRSAYRIRIGNYRLGFFVEDSVVIFSRFLHRKDIYKKFP
jgi:mRNA interferase RelE/StbE